MPNPNPAYIYRENDTKRKHPYVYKTCGGCGEVKLVRTTGNFCSRSCSMRAQHAEGPRAAMPSGATHYKWKGSEAGYQSLHGRVLRARGAASRCELREQAGCKSVKYEWAHIHGTDPGDPENYRELCKSCHQQYDRQTGADHSNAKLSATQAAAVRALYEAGGVSQEALGKLYGVHQTVIGRIIRGESYLETLK